MKNPWQLEIQKSRSIRPLPRQNCQLEKAALQLPHTYIEGQTEKNCYSMCHSGTHIVILTGSMWEQSVHCAEIPLV